MNLAWSQEAGERHLCKGPTWSHSYLSCDEGSHSCGEKVDSKHPELTVLETILFAVTRYLPRSDMSGEGFVLVHSSEEDSLSGRGR